MEDVGLGVGKSIACMRFSRDRMAEPAGLFLVGSGCVDGRRWLGESKQS